MKSDVNERPRRLYVIHALQLGGGAGFKGEHQGITWDPHPSIFYSQKEAEFYCKTNSNPKLIYWYDVCDVGHFTDSYMRKHPKPRRGKNALR